MSLFANLKVRVWQAAQFGPPALQVAAKRARVNHAQLVTLGEIFNRDDGIHDGRRGGKDRGPETEDGRGKDEEGLLVTADRLANTNFPARCDNDSTQRQILAVMVQDIFQQ